MHVGEGWEEVIDETSHPLWVVRNVSTSFPGPLPCEGKCPGNEVETFLTTHKMFESGCFYFFLKSLFQHAVHSIQCSSTLFLDIS